MSNEKHSEQNVLSPARVVIRIILAITAFGLMIFWTAGRLDYWQGWLFAAINLIIIAVTYFFLTDNPDLIKERMKPGPGTKWWDKIFFAFYIPLCVCVYVLASMDAGRYGWSPPFPIFVYVIGYGIQLFSHFLLVWSMRVNYFFSSTVRIQTDRGHRVVQDGPYQYVRHPGYVAGILLFISTSIVLGSLWGLVPAGLITVLLVIRTYLEDKTLQRELPGYFEYTQKVPYRLLVGIW